MGKYDSYVQVKESGIWMRDHSNPGDLIWSLSQTQHTYYTRRNVSNINYGINTSEQFDNFINNNNPRYVVFSVFEPVKLDWYNDWSRKNQYRLNIVNAYFADQSQTQALLVVYEINYNASEKSKNIISITSSINTTETRINSTL
jgi:hypothetical protein